VHGVRKGTGLLGRKVWSAQRLLDLIDDDISSCFSIDLGLSKSGHAASVCRVALSHRIIITIFSFFRGFFEER
jgi:hypothetical protein